MDYGGFTRMRSWAMQTFVVLVDRELIAPAGRQL
jgi:hypothetical protein